MHETLIASSRKIKALKTILCAGLQRFETLCVEEGCRCMPKRKASFQRPMLVALLGGGIDSTVMLSLYRQKGTPIVGIHYDYGQKALNGERRAIRKIARRYSVPVRWRRLEVPIKK